MIGTPHPASGAPFLERSTARVDERKPDDWLLSLVGAFPTERFVPLRVQSTSVHVIMALNITVFEIASQSSTVRQCGQAI